MTKRFFASLALLFLTLATLKAQAPAGKEELKLTLPKPMFIGTPTNLKSANLEAITGKPRGLRLFDFPRAMVDLGHIWRERLAHVSSGREVAAAFGES
jgi:hypothetical protein